MRPLRHRALAPISRTRAVQTCGTARDPCAHKQLLQIFHNPDISRVRREAAWESLKPDVGGPRDALLEWGPGQALGSIAFGSRPRGAMAQWINKKRDASR